jgi:hypothetical protein
MAPKTKSAPRQVASTSPLTVWARQGIESFVAAQKILLDLTAQQNALLIGMIRERLSEPGFQPGAALAKMADKGVENFTTAGKILLDFAAGETGLVVDGVKKGLRLSAPVAGAAEVFRHRVETLIGLQKRLLDAAAEQTHVAARSYREGKGLRAMEGVVELTRRGVEDFVDTEKKFLDLATGEVSTVLRGGKEVHEPAGDRSRLVSKLAREGVAKYIEAQKKLLDLAIQQFEAKDEVAERPEPHRKTHTTLAELTEKSVHNVVRAQKSLMDLAIKPIRKGVQAQIHKVGRRPVRGRKSALEASAAA